MIGSTSKAHYNPGQPDLIVLWICNIAIIVRNSITIIGIIVILLTCVKHYWQTNRHTFPRVKLLEGLCLHWEGEENTALFLWL